MLIVKQPVQLELRQPALAKTPTVVRADRQWQLLQPILLDSAMAWLDPGGKHGWAPPKSPMNSIEPICAALNLCRFLMIRERADTTNATQVHTSTSVCGVSDKQ